MYMLLCVRRMLSCIDMFSYVLLMSMFNVCLSVSLSVSLSITYDSKALKDLDHPEHFSWSKNDGAIYQKDVNVIRSLVRFLIIAS